MADRAKTDAELKCATSLSAINKLITGIKRAGDKLNETIHNAALMCFQHAKDFGDATPAARLVDAMPKSFRRSLVIGWFDEYSAIKIGKNAKTDQMKAHLKGSADEREGMWQLEAAKATPFYAMEAAEREPDVPTYENIHNSVVAFIKRTEAKAEKIADENERRKAEAEIDQLKHAIHLNNNGGPVAQAA